jgi:hypothetical protein
MTTYSSHTYTVGTNPDAVCFDGMYVWVANFSSGSSGNVTKILASSGAAVGTYNVGNQPEGICFDGTNIWVANNYDNTVTEIYPITLPTPNGVTKRPQLGVASASAGCVISASGVTKSPQLGIYAHSAQGHVTPSVPGVGEEFRGVIIEALGALPSPKVGAQNNAVSTASSGVTKSPQLGVGIVQITTASVGATRSPRGGASKNALIAQAVGVVKSPVPGVGYPQVYALGARVEPTVGFSPHDVNCVGAIKSPVPGLAYVTTQFVGIGATARRVRAMGHVLLSSTANCTGTTQGILVGTVSHGQAGAVAHSESGSSQNALEVDCWPIPATARAGEVAHCGVGAVVSPVMGYAAHEATGAMVSVVTARVAPPTPNGFGAVVGPLPGAANVLQATESIGTTIAPTIGVPTPGIETNSTGCEDTSLGGSGRPRIMSRTATLQVNVTLS